jgi:GxxExxY protein
MLYGKSVAYQFSMNRENYSTRLLNHYSGQVVNSAMKIHSRFGPGLLESAYEACLVHELRRRGLNVRSQVALPIEYEGMKLDTGYRIDVLVENQLIVELKTVKNIQDIHIAQILSYIKIGNLKLGLLINFNTVSLKDGIHRIVNNF